MSADTAVKKPPSTLGLTGLTVNAMALIAPGAFLWLTFFIQCRVRRAAGRAGHVVRHFRRRRSVPGHGHRVRRTVQALSRRRFVLLLRRAGVSVEDQAPRSSPAIAKFTVGWASHLYYWGYPGLMVGVTALARRVRDRSDLARHVQRRRAEPALHDRVLRGLLLRRRLHRVSAASPARTAVNAAINVIQITALIVFSVMAIGYRMNHPGGRARLDARSRTATRSTSSCRSTRRARPSRTPQGDFVVDKNAGRHGQAVHRHLRAGLRDADGAGSGRSEGRRSRRSSSTRTPSRSSRRTTSAT